MEKKSFGQMVCFLRKEKGMPQNDLAKKMYVTDKAVSKWERDLSFPDINSIRISCDLIYFFCTLV